MEQQVQGSRQRVRFGLFEADFERGVLRRSGVRVRIQHQPLKLLSALLEHPGDVVFRKDLQQQLWGTDTTVDFDHSLGIAVNKLRDALGDSAENPRFVETVAKQGYRFIAPVMALDELLDSGSAETGPRNPAAARRQSGESRVWRWIALVGTGLSLILGTALVFRSSVRVPYRIAQVTYSGRVLTNDMEVESYSSLASDGTRIYFSNMDSGNPELAIALSANGEISHFDLPSEIGAPLIGDISSDGSKLVVRSHLAAEPEQPLWIVPTLGGEAYRVPHVLAHDATWMPDGRHLLIASGNDLLVMNPDGSDAHKLLTTQGLVFWLRWSPDGKSLRYTLRDPKSQVSELWEVAADGSHPHPLLPGWSHPAAECCGIWTSDGEEYVFQSWHNGHSEIWAQREHPWFLRDSNPRQITNGPLVFQSPSPAPGGHRIYLIGANVQIELLHLEPRSSSFNVLGQTLGAAALVAYSRDDQWVAWVNASDGSLWRSRADGSERIELTTPPLSIFSMKWSPDGGRLALMAEEPGKPWKVYLIDADGREISPLLNEDRNEADPDWSPDGQSIVFGRLPDRMDNRQPKAIYLVHLQNRQVTEIPNSKGLFSPRFSPDGRYIAAMALDQRSLLLFDCAHESWTTLTKQGVGDPAWSHDGSFVYFQDFLEAGKPIYRISVPNGKPEAMATIGNLRPISATDYRLIGLAPDDLPIVSARTSTVNLYMVDLNER
jgi:Tol biopolymer transport system component/DNA-binding winged helix-turn-helix (wHTH) protein